ncbi:MAG: hypothetical protein EXS05_01450 [Planctomycetaceae bacterium]|nr:hypothetical protein [Planctomycetaceae bacterium]
MSEKSGRSAKNGRSAGKAKVATSAARKKATPRKAKAGKALTLGRPKVTNEELLYLLFKEDYHARQVFEFLRVNTVKDLEQYSAAEIIKRLSQPVRNTVERIRATLAGYNRCLADDLEYALERKAQKNG